MSREAWGDEGDVGPEGYVTDDDYEELKTAHREAVALLKLALVTLRLPELGTRLVAHDRIEAWLAENTVNGELP